MSGKMAGDSDRVAILIGALDALERFYRFFRPPAIEKLQEMLRPHSERIQRALVSTDNNRSSGVRALGEALTLLHQALEEILSADITGIRELMIDVMKVFRKICRVQEMVYPIRSEYESLNRFFLEPDVPITIGEFDGNAPITIGENGIFHIGMDSNPHARGGFSVYVPDTLTQDAPVPIVIGLHGGYGHGRDYLWTWVREARSRNFIVIVPTSLGQTWNILDISRDLEIITGAIDYVSARWNTDRNRMLLTGLSDGGTFALACCQGGSDPFSAFGPVSCTLFPENLGNARGKRIFRIHGTLDWMFPIDMARSETNLLRSAGAEVVFRELPDLSHAYPREMNREMIEWFDPGLGSG